MAVREFNGFGFRDGGDVEKIAELASGSRYSVDGRPIHILQNADQGLFGIAVMGHGDVPDNDRPLYFGAGAVRPYLNQGHR